MTKSEGLVSSWSCVLIAVVLGLFITTAAKAQESSNDEQNVTPSAADEQAARDANLVYRHVTPANTPAGRTLKHEDLTQRESSVVPSSTTTTTDNDGLRFEGDLNYLGGKYVLAARSHAIYLLPKSGVCSAITPCWGNPEGFLSDLAVSDFIHVADQYVHFASSNRYTLGSHAKVSYTPTPKASPLTDAYVQSVVHAAASKLGSGYGHIYHVFLPPGQDECMVPNLCYSPDVPGTFAFCGYHSSVDFTTIGHVLYTVEPFQDVPGCSVKPGTPNGQLADSTYNTLSHETFETITDPDGSAWFNLHSVPLIGQEIGDECSFFVIIPFTSSGQLYFDPSVFTIGAHRYAVQPEYSNSEHACAVSP